VLLPEEPPSWLTKVAEDEGHEVDWHWHRSRLLGRFDQIQPVYDGDGGLFAIEGMRIGQHRAYGYRNPGDDLDAMLSDLVSDDMQRTDSERSRTAEEARRARRETAPSQHWGVQGQIR
jgi:hypothetical protein